ncbi:hypothetical protein V501_08307 [Pseudogymnoascus sp. VKM F-4519 (FW-2642)]|nr:hypothetical protein V501_08307 [Pseudogymnoascus sp. VKM F-4519 (FW-2642)]
MSALPTPPITPFEATFLDVVNDIAEAHHPSPAIPAIPAIPHDFSLTPLKLLPKRLNYRHHQARRNPQAQVVAITEAEIAIAGPQMQNAMWGIDRVSESERAEAAAILEATVDRWVVSQRNGGMLPRWLCDDEKKSGRFYDRLWKVETARLIPWRYAPAGYTGPTLLYDVLIDRVRRIQIQDQARFRDAEDNLGVWGREMEVTMKRRENEEDTEDEEEEEDQDVEMREESTEDETEDGDSEEEETSGKETSDEETFYNEEDYMFDEVEEDNWRLRCE